MRVNISITKEDLFLIDEYCETIGIPRSKFFTRTALNEVGVHPKDIEALHPVKSQKPQKETEEVEVATLYQKGKKPVTYEIKKCKHGSAIGLCKFRCDG